MVARVPKACSKQGCLNTTTAKHGFCEEHKPIGFKFSKSSSKRGYGYRWQALRMQALKRDMFICVHCKAKGLVVRATEVDHILNKARGGTDTLHNLQSLCTACHRAKTYAERNGKG